MNSMIDYIVPPGAIMPFYLNSCPAGWIAADGNNGTPDLRNQFVRGMGQGRTLGSRQEDAIQNITGTFNANNNDGNIFDGAFYDSGILAP